MVNDPTQKYIKRTSKQILLNIEIFKTYIAQIDLHKEFPQLVIFMHFRMIGMLEKRIEVQSGKGVLRHIKDRLIPNIMTQRPKARKNIKEVLFLRQSIIKRRHQKILTKDTRV